MGDDDLFFSPGGEMANRAFGGAATAGCFEAMVVWICGSLRRSGRRRKRRRKRKRRGVAQSSETCSQQSVAALVETEGSFSFVSMGFPEVRGKLRPAAELGRTAFSEAQVSEAKVGG